jgi:hypothetical protein
MASRQPQIGDALAQRLLIGDSPLPPEREQMSQPVVQVT